MTFKPGNKWGAGRKDKPFRDALMMEIKAQGEDFIGLRLVAQALMKEANAGNIQAIREIADRTDGKVPQEAKIETGPLTSMSDDELASLIEAVNLLRDNGLSGTPMSGKETTPRHLKALISARGYRRLKRKVASGK